MTPKACDHCFQNKEKCYFKISLDICTRCQKRGILCHTSRKKKRKGRRPTLKPFGHGSLQIWEPGSSSKIEMANASSIMHVYNPYTNSTIEDIIKKTSPDTILATGYEGNKDSLFPRAFQSEIFWSSSTPPTTLDAMNIVKNEDRFATLHSPFAIGRKFIPKFRVAIYTILYHSAPAITDGYLAFLALVAHYQASYSHKAIPDHQRGTKGLQILQNLEILRSHDALCVLLLGQALFVFEILANSSAGAAHSIVQSSLISAKPWFSALNQVPDFDTITFCPVLLDIVGCLARRKLPIIRLCGQNRIVVDRYVGLCFTLLPLLYCLCEQSYNARIKADSAAVNPDYELTTGEHAEELYKDIESCIETWVPEIPPDFYTTYDQVDRQLMTIQANAYRLAALLVIHRLRFPLGVQDNLGRFYAHAIFQEISSFFALGNVQSAGAFPVIFPLFISMFEVEGPGENLLRDLRRFPIQNTCMSRMHDFVRYVRRRKELGFKELWFDLVESELACALIP